MITETTLRALLIRFGDCQCGNDHCHPDCPPCTELPDGANCLAPIELTAFERCLQVHWSVPYGQASLPGGVIMQDELGDLLQKASLPSTLLAWRESYARLIRQARSPGVDITTNTQAWAAILRKMANEWDAATLPAGSIVRKPDTATLRMVADMLNQGRPIWPDEVSGDDPREG